MKKCLSTVIVLAMLAAPLMADDTERAEGIEATKAKMLDIISQANSAKANNSRYTENYNNIRRINQKLDGNYYKKTAADDYTKAQVMSMIGSLAETAAYSIGTAGQAQQAALLSQQAAAMAASGDPNYQALAAQLNQLAAAVSSGNDIQAQTLAQGIQAYSNANAPAIDSSYKPTPQENSLLAGLGSVLANSLGTIGSMLSSFALSKLLTLIGGAALAGNPLTAAIGIILSSCVGAVASSITTGGVVNWQPAASTAQCSGISVAGQGSNSFQNTLSGSLQQNLAQTTPWISTNSSAVVQGSQNAGGTNKAPTQ